MLSKFRKVKIMLPPCILSFKFTCTAAGLCTNSLTPHVGTPESSGAPATNLWYAVAWVKKSVSCSATSGNTAPTCAGTGRFLEVSAGK